MKYEADDPRRRLLIQMLAAGFFTGTAASREALAQICGSPPSKLPEGKSIYRISGDVTVDGKKADLGTKVVGGSTIQTGRDSELVYAVGESAYIARPNTQIVVETSTQEAGVVTGIKLLAGKAAVGVPEPPPGAAADQDRVDRHPRNRRVPRDRTPEQTYFCTCYGVADVASQDDRPARRRSRPRTTTVRSTSSARARGPEDPQRAVHQPYRPGADAGRDAGGPAAALRVPEVGLHGSPRAAMIRTERRSGSSSRTGP
jgi:hypothetical protein